MTKNGGSAMIGMEGRCYITGGWPISCDFGQKEVVRMWKKRVLVSLRYLVFAALAMHLLTTKAC